MSKVVEKVAAAIDEKARTFKVDIHWIDRPLTQAAIAALADGELDDSAYLLADNAFRESRYEDDIEAAILAYLKGLTL